VVEKAREIGVNFRRERKKKLHNIQQLNRCHAIEGIEDWVLEG
jgi:hypothetical protein